MKNWLTSRFDNSRAAQVSRQRGSIVVMAAIGISTMVILLASIDIGYLFFQKREMQKVADMAALAGAQQLGRSANSPDDQCASGFAVARGNAQTAQNFTGTLTIACGRWDPSIVVNPPHFQVYQNGVRPNGAPAPTAISVLTTRNFRSFFGTWANRDVTALAIATADAPIAVFSVGSRLLRFDGGVVPGLLTRLGVDISGTSLVSYNGLANASVTPAGLLKQLGFQIPVSADVGTIKTAVMANVSGCTNGACTLQTLLGAVSTVAGQQNLVSALGLSVAQLNLPVQIFSDATGRGGIFALVNAANGQSALTANVNALELVTAMIGVGNGHRFADAPLGVSVPGVLNSQVKIGIVEPPSIGIGGIGTTAFTAQVRVFAQIQSNLLNANLLKADIPMVIDVVNGFGTITDMCRVKINGKDSATITVTSPVLQTCVGGYTAANAFAVNAPACNATAPAHPLLNVLNGGLQINTNLFVNGLPNTGIKSFVKGESYTFPGNNLALGTTVSNLMDGVLAKLLNAILGGTAQGNGQGTVTNSTLAAGLLGAVSQAGNVLDTAIGTVKDALSVLNTFISSIGTNASLLDMVGSLVAGVLNTVSTAVNGLFTGIGNILVAVLCGFQSQCILAHQLDGTQNGTSKVLVTILGLVTKLLEPILDGLGAQIATLLNNLLGISIGQVDVTLIDLKCGGGDSVRLVH
ncbi:hypothetical protein D3C72_134990 [compost metagenome]